MCETGMKGGRKRKQWLRYRGKLKFVHMRCPERSQKNTDDFTKGGEMPSFLR